MKKPFLISFIICISFPLYSQYLFSIIDNDQSFQNKEWVMKIKECTTTKFAIPIEIDFEQIIEQKDSTRLSFRINFYQTVNILSLLI